jgi:hypothetical protein
LVTINGVDFEPLPGVRYVNNYPKIVEWISDPARPEFNEINAYRECVLTDLWFLVYFIFRLPAANHPFVINACREIQGASSADREIPGEMDSWLDLWGREHYKTTIITHARTLQHTLRSRVWWGRDVSTAIFSYTREAAKSLLRPIRTVCEESELLKACFDDCLYANPGKESPVWTESAICFKRDNYRKEVTFEAWGLIEGMPTGRHFPGRVYDDVETQDNQYTGEVIQKVKDAFDMSQNLGENGGWHWVIGTPYHNEGLLQELRYRRDTETGELLYRTRLKPSTEDGTYHGKPVLLTPERMRILRANSYQFRCQHLLDPTPKGERPLDSELLRVVRVGELPKRLYKFMVIDGAGDSGKRRDGRRSDNWAISVVGVNPCLDEIGASEVFILDMVLSPMSHAEAMKYIVDMYCRHGRIMQVGVEKVAISTTEIHVANALKARGRHISRERGNLVVLRPEGRSKESRIEAALQWPLENGKIAALNTIPEDVLVALRSEMDKFPHSKFDDGLDNLAYVYDLLRGVNFSKFSPEVRVEENKQRWRRRNTFSGGRRWMSV